MMRSETEHVRDIWEADAGRYDTGMGLMERLLFGGGRRWEPLDWLSSEGFEAERVERHKVGVVERVSARRTPIEP